MSNINTPKEIAVDFCKSGVYKANLSFSQFMLLAFLGGTFIAFGGLLSVIVAGGMPTAMAANPGLVKFIGGAMFPIGLIMVSVAGADLFTSDCAAMVLPVMQRELKIKQLLKVWLWAYVFNFVGALFVAYFMANQVGLLSAEPWTTYLHKLATRKVEMDFSTIFLKGIGANWLVCLGAWMGFAAKDVTGKAIGIWIPVMLFVTLGYEHSIANMFFIPAAIFSGADITWYQFGVVNLIPATLGNIVGGACFVGCLYWYIYLRKQK